MGRRQLAVLVVLGVCFAGCEQLETRLIQRTAARALSTDRTDLLDDGRLHVVLCGTGCPLADAERAGPCTAVLAGGHFFVVDSGPGAWRQVALMRLPRARVEAVLLTHFHSDHIGEVGEAVVQTWIGGRTAPLLIYGPPGVGQVLDGFRQAYAFDTQYRMAHHGSEAMPPAGGSALARAVEIPEPGEAAVVFEGDGLRVTAFAVDHAPVAPAYGYRFDYHGRSVVLSGDTSKSANLVHHARNADLLVHEALAAHMLKPVQEYASGHGLTRWAKMTGDIVNYHATPIEAAEVAKAAEVRMLALTHIVPPLPNFIARRIFLRGVADAWDGRIVLGHDAMHFSLPPGSAAIDVDDLS